MTLKTELVHGTCVSLGANAAILKGKPGSGKSDLALRFIFTTPQELDPALIADDQIRVEASEGRLLAFPPKKIAGQIEVRGIGIITLPYRRSAQVRCIVHLVNKEDVPRLPPSPLERQTICGVDVPILLLSPFETSAALKLRLALQGTIR